MFFSLYIEGIVWLDFFLKRHINLRGLFNAKAFFIEEQQWYYLTDSWKVQEVHAFLKGISRKMNVMYLVIVRIHLQWCFIATGTHSYCGDADDSEDSHPVLTKTKLQV